MIVYIKGDIFKTDKKIIAHGCNCRGGFGSGVAATVARLHPKAREAYLKKHQTVGWKLGETQYVESNGKIIVNCATQDRYGNGQRDGIVYADYPAIEKVMKDLKEYSKKTGYDVTIPLIGAGLANGDWKKIEAIINQVFNDQDIFVYLYKP